MTQRITPFLWFDGRAEEAMNFYTSIFPNSKIDNINHISPDGNMAMGTFTLDGQQFMALDGGPMFTFSPAISLFVSCETQAEVDDLWARLGEGGSYQQCAWLSDKFGISWQIVPTALGRLMGDPDPVKSQRVMQAMMQMTKIDIQGLQDAYDGPTR
jgi:predicted 3-demethylubiquinone-9 3-methyltransferase (glyoxalase superfamily)